MDEEKIKEAFLKVKQDIDFLKIEMQEIKQFLQSKQEKQVFHPKIQTSTLRHINSTHSATSTHTSTVPQEVEGLKSLNLRSSIGNQGASTDRQTDTSTDTSTHNLSEIPQKTQESTISNIEANIEQNIQEASEILDSLDALKKEIRLKFKRITQQEMLVFSTIYQLEEQDPENSTYREISQKLNLSESSIRDYVQRMINKGIPIKKQKINNKKLILSISPELKKIATLSTIIRLRGL